MAQVHAGLATPGTVFFAHEQFAGKGQRGKTWTAKAGENITMSIVLQPKGLRIDQQFVLSAALAVACHDLLAPYSSVNFSIKWPNDLYWRDRKTGGILIENIVQGAVWDYAIAGIGININQQVFDHNLPNPVSLAQITGITHDPVELAKKLCAAVDKRYRELLSGKEPDLILIYNSLLYKRNQTARLKSGDRIFDVTIREVTAQGKMITRDLEERSFDFGDCQWVI